MPEPGTEAPDFEGVTQTGATIRLSDFRGAPVALYFYPKDDTPGCTKQACNLRDNESELEEHGVKVIGVSGDPVSSHVKFASKYDLSFPLVADTEREIMTAYGVYGEKSFYGKTVIGVKRTTFLIGADGVILHVFKRPKTDRHAEEILGKLQS